MADRYRETLCVPCQRSDYQNSFHPVPSLTLDRVAMMALFNAVAIDPYMLRNSLYA